jgi:hypothetical protein
MLSGSSVSLRQPAHIVRHRLQLVVVDVQPPDTGQLRDLVGDRQARVLAERQRFDGR